ncbi:MAG: hypothetical protein ACYCW6_06165 [Candidatus Xenobia bacterium]
MEIAVVGIGSVGRARRTVSYRMVWEAQPLAQGEPRLGHWLVFSDCSEQPSRLIGRLEDQGNTTHVVGLDSGRVPG